MKHTLTFNSNKSLVKLAKDTMKASNFKVAYRDKYTPEKCFYLVKDDGIYLMEAYDSKKSGSANGTVVYASGYNPKYNEDVWEDAYRISSDDFAMNVNLTNDQLERMAQGGNITINLHDDYYEVIA